jgi:ATP-dependent DNA helicase RecQ
VVPKINPSDQLLEFVSKRRNESGIVYCFSRKGAESVAARLNEAGIKARPYHAGLTPKERSLNQELFLREEVRVIAATIAFGMGINATGVRYVIHYDLPKNIEGYYQETGRAGRDGLPSECLLFFSAADAIKQSAFIDEKPNPQEQRIAREQLQQMVHYAESAECRRVTLLRYFGEEYPDEQCEGCDNCLEPRETYDGTVATQKFLSCIYRVREKTGCGFGLNHMIEVLTGADTELVRKWRHNEVSTYGIGKDLKRAEWQAIGRQLIRLGYVRQASERFSVVELTQEGVEILKQRKKVILTKSAAPKAAIHQRSGEIPCDETLFDRLRVLRRRVADEADIPAYIVFSDVALREMANKYPENEAEFARIPGVGKRKLEEYAQAFIEEIAAYLRTYPRQIFQDSFTAPAARPKTGMSDTVRETMKLFHTGLSPQEIATARSLVIGTIYGHFGAALEVGEPLRVEQFFTVEEQKLMAAALEKTSGLLGEAKELLGGKFGYGELRLYSTLASKGA